MFRPVNSLPHCDNGVSGGNLVTSLKSSHVAPFPGGSLKRLFGFDMAAKTVETLSKAPGAMGSQAGAAQLIGLTS